MLIYFLCWRNTLGAVELLINSRFTVYLFHLIILNIILYYTDDYGDAVTGMLCSLVSFILFICFNKIKSSVDFALLHILTSYGNIDLIYIIHRVFKDGLKQLCTCSIAKYSYYCLYKIDVRVILYYIYMYRNNLHRKDQSGPSDRMYRVLW